MSKILTMLALLASNAAALDDGRQTANPVVQWNRALLVILRTAGAQPATVHPTHSFALMHAAVYDAVNSIERSHRPYLVQLTHVWRHASQEAAAASAAHQVLVDLYPAFQEALDEELQRSLAPIPDGRAKDEGIRIGQTVAKRILALRSNDGSDAEPIPYVFGHEPGDYQSTPPNFPPQPQFTHWPFVTPFALPSAELFRPEPPPTLESHQYADDFNEVKSLGVVDSTKATPEEMLIGRFWNGPIQNFWNEITQSAVLAHHLSTARSARLFALLDLSMADGVIAFYDAKYTYNFWRPVTAIRAADPTINPETLPDPDWLPEVINTAPDPSYPGAHAVISSVGATVLIAFFERDHFVFNVTSEVLPGVERHFTRISAAGEEATLSRIFAGQHFRFDETAGQLLGQRVADFALEHILLPRRGEHQSDQNE